MAQRDVRLAERRAFAMNEMQEKEILEKMQQKPEETGYMADGQQMQDTEKENRIQQVQSDEYEEFGREQIYELLKKGQ